MKPKRCYRWGFLPLSFVALAVFSSNLKANAEDPNSPDALPLEESTIAAPAVLPQPTLQRVAMRVVEPIPGEAETSANQLSQSIVPDPSLTPTKPTGAETIAPTTIPSVNTSTPLIITPNTGVAPTLPESDTVRTNSITIPTQETTQPGLTVQSTTEVSPGRATRSGSSYVGVGGNIGIGSGDTQLGQGSFAVVSKVGLLPSVSVRPAFLFSDNLTILVPITYDFSFGEGPTEGLNFSAAPYLGVGVAISTGDDSDVGLLLSGGIDVPLSSQFTATASVNASVTGEAAVGILLGVGYNFQGF
jgi:hypothetical protein